METQDDFAQPRNPDSAGQVPAEEAAEPPGMLSPVRPAHLSGDDLPKPHLIPAKPDTGALAGQRGREGSPPSEKPSINSQEVLDQLRSKMAQAAREFAEGKLNRAQFYAIYARYSEQRTIVERLLARDPESQAWQQAARPGHTAFLRQHFAARILSFAIYDLGQTTAIVRRDIFPPRPEDVLPILRALPGLIRQRGPLGPARRQVSGGRWLVVVPGQYTVSVVLYSLEPSAQQITQIADLHRDFERANIHALERGDRSHERLVFPQRALFEGQAFA